ncbi:dipeptidase [Rhodocaloribacter litoris]|uniref:dipeptidase n=1 Tax=Rhodocaloribacter litoris TaxID=2558931 RepID=UPI00142111FD|nr:dipeptidase [Rhodocaloribacter litoris]QXD16753.1 dipeptidase [Rhodocaloribacter litoris]
MEKALAYAGTHFDDFVAQLQDLLRIPSISTDPDYRDEVRRAAGWLADHLETIGMAHTEVLDTAGHPVVYAEHVVDPARPTVLVYGHYDVQPPDPLALWTSPPFEPVIRDGVIYARGACDDKGQLFMHLKAAEAYLATGEGPPVNLKFLLEGEEESGSEHLPGFIEAHHERLAADIVLISDTDLFGPGIPSITYGLRGLAYLEVTLTGPNRDLHSGMYGGAVENPINALCRLIAGLHDADHRVTIPGFYDNVVPLTEEERATFRALPFDEQAWAKEVGLPATKTEKGYSVLEAISARPTLDVNGIWGGYTGKGAKTVLPAQAHAKISMRLVPDQRPEEIAEKARAYFEANCPPTMKLSFRYLHGGPGVLVDTHSPAMQAAARALKEVFGRDPFFIRSGGSIPVVSVFKKRLGLDSVLMGFGLTSDAIHSPNEHFGLDRFRQGIESIIRFQTHYARTR